MPRDVLVTAPSRLHFGLYALAATPGSAARSYGGVGVMISEPGIKIRITPAASFAVSGPLADRASRFAARWAEFYAQSLTSAHIEVVSAPPDHIGLGTGTQLGLAVSAGLTAFQGLPVPGPEELARSVGRGQRSAVGAYGFCLGGLIAERGKLADELLSPLDCRIALPDAWRFVLVRPEQGEGLAGACEQKAIDSINQDFSKLTEQLRSEARDALIPGAALGNFSLFAESLGYYCELAGQFYADVQGGPYNGPLVTALAKQINELHCSGFGQSSWGPTLFVACESEREAQEISQELSRRSQFPVVTSVTSVANTSASVRVCA